MQGYKGINRILFIIPFSNTDKENHLYNKLRAQINGAKEAGFEVCYTEYDESNLFISTENERILIAENINTKRNISVYNEIFKSIKRIKDLFPFDTVFIRRIAAIPSYLRALKYIKKNGAKIILELPTYPYVDERKNSKRKLFYSFVSFLDATIGRAAEKYVDLCAVIGQKTDKVGTIPALNVNNGVDVSLYPITTKNMTNNMVLISVASFCYWHGLDRLIEGLREYYTNSNEGINITLNVVGNSKDGTIDSLKTLVEKYGLQDKVIFHGFKSGDELNDVFSKSDIAIASLGLHRKGLKNSSTLKVREYCARGIPIVYAGDDPCLDVHPDLFLKLEEDETPINIDKIIEYSNVIRGNEETYHNKVRKIASEEMSWKKEFLAISERLVSMEK